MHTLSLLLVRSVTCCVNLQHYMLRTNPMFFIALYLRVLKHNAHISANLLNSALDLPLSVLHIGCVGLCRSKDNSREALYHHLINSINVEEY